MPAAIQLGKALFWDMQVGSDGIQACATCHFRAGAEGSLEGLGVDDKYVYGRRPTGFYIPRYRNLLGEKRPYGLGAGGLVVQAVVQAHGFGVGAVQHGCDLAYEEVGHERPGARRAATVTSVEVG